MKKTDKNQIEKISTVYFLLPLNEESAENVEYHNKTIDILKTSKKDKITLVYSGLNNDIFSIMKYARKQLPQAAIIFYAHFDTLNNEHFCLFEAVSVEKVIWNISKLDNKTLKKIPFEAKISSFDMNRIYITSNSVNFNNFFSKEITNEYCDELFIKTAGEIFYPLSKNNSFLDELTKDKKPLLTSEIWNPGQYISKPEGKRLIILPTYSKDLEACKVVLASIAKNSVMDGEVIILWNDDKVKKCPLKNPGKNVKIFEYPKSLGWQSLAKGLADALYYAMENQYDWAIKLDSDTALLSSGWDALLCSECPPHAILCDIVSPVQSCMTLRMPPLKGEEDLAENNKDLLAVYWAKGYVEQGKRGWEHIQGGLYMFGKDALKRMDKIIGIYDCIEESSVWDDYLWDTKARICKVPVLKSKHIVSSWKSKDIPLDQIRYWRDVMETVIFHPVKDKNTLEILLHES